MNGNEAVNIEFPIEVDAPNQVWFQAGERFQEALMHNFTVSTLSDLVLKYLIQRVVDALPTINERTVKSWIKSYQSIRELILNIQLLDQYQSLSDKILKPLEENGEDYEKAKFLLWQCFENIDTKRLSCCQLLEIDDKILSHGAGGKMFSEVMKSQEKLLKCEALAFQFFTLPSFLINSEENFLGKLGVSKDTPEYPFDQIGQVFEKMPNLNEITINIPNEDLNTKVLTEILPNYSNLKKLRMSVYSENELDAFCKFVEESPKTLEFLDINFVPTISTTTLNKVFKMLKLLPNLAVFNPFFKSSITNENIEPTKEDPESEKVQQVKQIKFQNPTMEEFKFILSKFINVKSLIIPLYKYDQNLWTNVSFESLDLQHFKKLQYLEITTFIDNTFPIRVPVLFNQFPNLKVFVTNNFECNYNELPEMKTLEKLVVANGEVNPPKLLKKLVNLSYFRMRWPKNPARKLEAVNVVKPFLTPHCKLFEIVYNHGSENTEKEIIL